MLIAIFVLLIGIIVALWLMYNVVCKMYNSIINYEHEPLTMTREEFERMTREAAGASDVIRG